MCLMAPAQVLAVEPDFAIVGTDGRRRRASTALVGEIQAGDWVVITGGAIVRRVEADQAEMMARASSAPPPASMSTTTSTTSVTTTPRRTGHRAGAPSPQAGAAS